MTEEEEQERKDRVGAMIQAIADAVEGASILDGASAMAWVFADIALQADTNIHEDLYRFGEMVLSAVESMAEDDDEGAEPGEGVLQ